MNISITLLLFVLFLGAASYTYGKKDSNNTNLRIIIKPSSEDTIKLRTLIIRLYEWVETKNSKNDFEPKKTTNQDRHYIGINWDAHNVRIKELESTNFFSKEFFDNYNKIANTIDTELQKGKMEWLVGDIPPFGSDVNPWCNCQENMSPI